jgi:UDP-N-acetylmuramate--alanine ligase
MQLLHAGTRVHLVGIGGIGLSGIARVLHAQGYCISGSDQQQSALTDALVAEGMVVHIGHRPENLFAVGDGRAGGLLVVVSSAIGRENPEVIEAQRRGIPVVKRDQLLGEMTAGKHTIAVAGTHGKTTTSAMVAWILVQAGLDPTFVVGGVLQNLGINARAGGGSSFVIEADEYDRAFLGLSPDLAVITVLEHDHPDCYPTFRDMQEAFAEFAGRAAQRGRLIVCGEDAEALQLGERVAEQYLARGVGPARQVVVTYGFAPNWDWQAEDVELEGCPTFRVRRGSRRLGRCALQLPGRHNVLNALAALAACAEIGVEFETAAAALARFRGTARRFEVKGQAGGVTVVDDYAHHPTEIRATLAAARSKYPGRGVWAVFQPHTYSRTAALLDGFATAFDDADHVLVTGIYAAREEPAVDITAADIVTRMKAARPGVAAPVHPDARYVETLDQAVAALAEQLQPGDILVTLGAGDGYRVGERVLDLLRANGANHGHL